MFLFDKKQGVSSQHWSSGLGTEDMARVLVWEILLAVTVDLASLNGFGTKEHQVPSVDRG